MNKSRARYQDGLQEGWAYACVCFLTKKFGHLSPDNEAGVRALPVERLKALVDAIDEFRTETDLDDWLK